MELLSPKQIWLLSFQNPLKERFGAEFIKNIPKTPGVYWMIGKDSDQILYIGKAKNLRNRIRSYRQVKPDVSSRKLLRLVQAIREIHWEVCETETAALLKENQLLRKFKPPYNTVNTHPETYYLIGLTCHKRHLSFRLTMNPSGLSRREQLFGSFKGRGMTRNAYAALLRLLWCCVGDTPVDRFEFPSVLVRRRVPYRYEFLLGSHIEEIEKKKWNDWIGSFLNGTSKKLLVQITHRLLELGNVPAFFNHMIQDDLNLLSEWYGYGPRRNYRLKKFHKLTEKVVAQDEIDDLLVTYQRVGSE